LKWIFAFIEEHRNMSASQHSQPKEDIEIARDAQLRPIREIAAMLDIQGED